MNGLVGEVAADNFQLSRRFAACLVVVEVSINLFVRRDERNSFGEVRYRVQHGDIVRRGRVALERQEREVVHKSLEDEAHRIIAMSGRRGFRCAALEIAVAQLPTSGIVAESDGEIGFVRHAIMHLRTMSPRRIEVNAPLHEVVKQGGIFQQSHLLDDN